jgi:hypothetical protein
LGLADVVVWPVTRVVILLRILQILGLKTGVLKIIALMMMEEANNSETSVSFYQTTRRKVIFILVAVRN